MGRMHRANGLNPWRLPSSDADVGLLPLRSVLDGFTGDLFVELAVRPVDQHKREQVIVTHASRLSTLLEKLGS